MHRLWCGDSCRHVIYNTLWTSNRLIKYILYKYISYCTCRSVQPLAVTVPLGRRHAHLDTLLLLPPTYPRPDGQQYCPSGAWLLEESNGPPMDNMEPKPTRTLTRSRRQKEKTGEKSSMF